MRGIAAVLAMKVDGWVPRIIRRRLVGRVLVLWIKALQARPGFNQRPVDGEVFHRQEVPLPRLGQHAREEGLRDIAIQQALPVLRERRRVPDRLVHVQPDEPAEQQVVIQLLHQLPLTAHREEHLQQQGPQQFLRRDRGAANLRIEFGERGRQLMQHRVHHAPDHAQRMVLRGRALPGRGS